MNDSKYSTDGTENREHYLMLSRRWGNQAEENIEKRGKQNPMGLLLAIAEEMAEIADEILDPDNLSSNDTEAQLLLQSIRQVGYDSRDYLESRLEDPDGNPLPLSERPDLSGVASREAAIDETEDLAPLIYQLYWALEAHSADTDNDQTEDANGR